MENEFATPERERGGFKYFAVNKGAFTLPATKEDSENGGKAKARIYEVDGEDGKKIEKVKYEFRFQEIGGIITDFELKDGKYGEQFILEFMNPNTLNKCKIQMSVKSKYFDSIARVFKNIDLGEEVLMKSYDFEAEQDNGKKKRIIGITVFQKGEKLENYYYDNDIKSPINGFPVVDEEEKEAMGKTDYWASFFLKVNVFFKKEIRSVENTNAGLGGAATPLQDDDLPADLMPSDDMPLSIEDAEEILGDSAE